MRIEGSYVALVTPFYPDGSVNFDKLRELCRWHIENGTDGIVVLGTTGESSTMTHEEDDQVVRAAIDEVAGRVPIIAGTGSNCTETAIMKSKAAQKMGADGILIITPYYNKANERGMYRHFTEVMDAVGLPSIIYNVPGRTGCSLSVNCVEALAKHPCAAALKEASGNISYAARISRFITDEFQIMSGNDDMVVPMMALGASGVISVFANVCPAECHDMVHSFLSGDVRRAREIQLRYLDLINALFIEVNPIPVKEAMNMLGMEAGAFRLPLCEMEENNRAALRRALAAVGRLK